MPAHPARPGTVYLVGGGPGDPGLITVRGQELLRQADAILYDALINPSLLRQAPATARLIDVGKRAGQQHLSQDDINRLLLELAHTCQTVVRLKGGDPFVFGRGGEELEFLRAAGVPVEVVPGVSSAIGALAYAGVPVTHRGLAANFAVITGHRAAEADDTTDWAALTKLDTLVILMGLKKLPQICAQLLAAGKPADTPAVAIQWGTLPDQKIVRGTLDQLADAVAEAQLVGPTIIVVGAVAMLADTLNWFSATNTSVEHIPTVKQVTTD